MTLIIYILPHQIFMTMIKSLGAGISVQRKLICARCELQCMPWYTLTMCSICGCVILYAFFTILRGKWILYIVRIYRRIHKFQNATDCSQVTKFAKRRSSKHVCLDPIYDSSMYPMVGCDLVCVHCTWVVTFLEYIPNLDIMFIS